MTLMKSLLEELDRNQEILTTYESIPQGVFGATMIRRDMVEAKKAISEGDTVAMMRVYETLKETKA